MTVQTHAECLIAPLASAIKMARLPPSSGRPAPGVTWQLVLDPATEPKDVLFAEVKGGHVEQSREDNADRRPVRRP